VSAEDIEIAKRFATTMVADKEGMFALLSDDVEWTTPKRTLRGLEEVREKLGGGGTPDNLDVEWEEGEWQDDGAGTVVCESRVVQRWKETGEVATVMRVREELQIREGKITRYARRGQPEETATEPPSGGQ
jgi:ketosteroid isomerase-like protein